MLCYTHTESIINMGNNNYFLCHHWSDFFTNDCQRLQLGDPINDHIPTETSGTSDGPSNPVTNTADTSTSKGSRSNVAVIIAASISGAVIIFLLMIVTMIAIVCIRKRHQQSISDHLIHGPVGLDLKCEGTSYRCSHYLFSTVSSADTPKHQPLNYYSEVNWIHR